MNKPQILIILDHSFSPVDRLFINLAYLREIERIGGVPILVGRPNSMEVARLVGMSDGVFLTGGDDVDPQLYGEAKTKICGKVDPTERDRVEGLILEGAHARKLPILGVCRGMQIINVHFGGTLYQDIKGEMKNAVRHDFHKDSAGVSLERNAIAHDIQVEAGTLLKQIVKETKFPVNSLHHQGIKSLGKNLKKSASAPDGLIEGIELVDYPFCVGVQWHPEELNDDPSRALFAAFVEAAQTYRNRRISENMMNSNQ